MYHRGAYHVPRFHMRNAALGLICAVALALALSDLAIFGIAIWKIELAIIGLLLFVTAGRKAS
jgi:membrane-bound ClpP family serine protease